MEFKQQRDDPPGKKIFQDGFMHECMDIQIVSDCEISVRHNLPECAKRDEHSILSKEKSLWKSVECIIDPEEQLGELDIKGKISPKYNGVTHLTVNSNKFVSIQYNRDNIESSTFKLSPDEYHNIEQLIQMIPLEDLETNTICGWSAHEYIVTISTSKFHGKIFAKGCLPYGFWDIMEYIEELNLDKKNN